MIFIAWYFTWWQKCQMKSWIWVLTGFEISDVLSINDKDYSITFGLYFSVEWMEPRLNLSKELWGEENVAGEDDLVPGERIHHNTKGSLNYNICNWVPNFSQPGVDKKPLDSQYFHLQPKDIQNNWRPLQTCRSLDRLQEEDLLQPGHQHHLHLPHVVWLLPLGYPEVQVSGESGTLYSDKVKAYFVGWQLLLRHEPHGVRCLHLGLHPEFPVHHPGLWDHHQEPEEEWQNIWGWSSWKLFIGWLWNGGKYFVTQKDSSETFVNCREPCVIYTGSVYKL